VVRRIGGVLLGSVRRRRTAARGTRDDCAYAAERWSRGARNHAGKRCRQHGSARYANSAEHETSRDDDVCHNADDVARTNRSHTNHTARDLAAGRGHSSP
jgi:hypothetical protein